METLRLSHPLPEKKATNWRKTSAVCSASPERIARLPMLSTSFYDLPACKKNRCIGDESQGVKL
jgi:hypothetical protein